MAADDELRTLGTRGVGERPGGGEILHAGDVVAGYQVREVAGIGGMGVVYRAIDLELGRTVALKLIRGDDDSRARELFVRESLVAAALEHPNVIPIYRAGEDQGRLYIAMRFVEGASLQDLIDEGPLPAGRAARIVARVAEALDAAHAKGLIHRDVKPANILIADPEGEEHVYLTDFGIATTAAREGGRWAGTLAYLAPEQIRGERLDARTDVYALGCVLFHALSGRAPFDIRDEIAAFEAHVNTPPPRLSEVAEDVPPGLDEVVAKALSKRPEDRFQTAGELGLAALAARFDVAICAIADDRHTADVVAGELRQRGLSAVLGIGDTAREVVRSASGCAVLVGPGGLGAWAREPLAVAHVIAQRDRAFRIVAALLPGGPDPLDPELAFLGTSPWADLRGGVAEGTEDLLRALRGAAPSLLGETLSDVCPYRGLEAFDEEHAADFFGREGDVARVVERLRNARFLAVVGASGSGKSSLIHAGVIPALRRGGVAGAERWRIVDLVPGAHPLASLAGKLADVTGSHGPTPADLRASDACLDLALARALEGQPENERVLIVVDQMEELFTLAGDPGERAAFLGNLAYATTIPGGRGVVIAALRADFYHRLGDDPAIRTLAAANQVALGPMDAAGLRRAIEQPALRGGLELEPGLTRRILTDVGGRPGTLPLLEHLLYELWQRRSGRMLTLEAYGASGGVEGSLARRANAVYDGLTPERQAIARRVLLRLTQPGEGTEDTRRRATLRELATSEEERPEVEAVVEALAGARLLTTGRDEVSGEPVVDVTHEALIRGWPELRGWIDEDREALRLHRRLTDAAGEWETAGREDGLLYRGPRLAAWEGRDLSVLNDSERDFLSASREREQRDRAARRRRTRYTFAGLAVALVIVGAVAGVALWQRGVASDQRQTARSQSLVNASKLQLSQDPELALLLAAQAYRTRKDRASEEELRRALHESHLQAAARFPQGEPIALADLGNGRVGLVTADGKMQVWDSIRDPRGQALQAVSWPGGAIVDMAGLRGGRVATIDEAGRVAVGAPPAPPHVVGRHTQAAAIAATPDGSGFVTVGGDGAARRWSANGGAPIVLVRGAPPLVSVAPAAGGLVVVDDETGALSAWKGGRRLSAPSLEGLDTNWLSASPGGRWVGAANTDGFVIWRVEGDRLVQVLRRPGGQGMNWVAITTDGRVAATAGGDGRQRLWSVPAGQPLGVLLGQGSGGRVVFDAARHVLLSTGTDGSARAWDWQGSADPTLTDLPLMGGVSKGSVAYLSDGRPVIIDGNGRARVWVPASERTTKLLGPAGSSVVAAAGTPDGRTIATAFEDGRLLVRESGGRQLLATGPTNVFPDEVALSRDGRTLVVGTDSGLVRRELGGGAQRAPAPLSDAAVAAAAVSPDGTLAAAGTLDGATVLWSADGSLRTINHQTGQITGLAFSPDGRYLASAGFDRLVRVLDLKGNAPTIVLRGHADSVLDVAFSRDGDYLASAGRDGMRLWDWRRGVSVLDVPSGERHDLTVAVAPDGRHVLVLDDGGTVHQVTCDVCIPQDQLLALASSRVTRGLTAQERKDFIGT